MELWSSVNSVTKSSMVRARQRIVFCRRKLCVQQHISTVCSTPNSAVLILNAGSYLEWAHLSLTIDFLHFTVQGRLTVTLARTSMLQHRNSALVDPSFGRCCLAIEDMISLVSRFLCTMRIWNPFCLVMILSLIIVCAIRSRVLLSSFMQRDVLLSCNYN